MLRVALGPFPDYLNLAVTLGTDCFSVPIDAWNAMAPEARWAANQAFLDHAIARGAIFICAVPPDEASDSGYFMRERDYLIEVGFELRRGETHWELFR